MHMNSYPTLELSTQTDTSGRYRFNVYDLQFFYGVPITLESAAYTVSANLEGGEEGGIVASVLRTIQGYVTSFLSIFRPGSRTRPDITDILPHRGVNPISTPIQIIFTKIMSQDATENAISLKSSDPSEPEPALYFSWTDVTAGGQPYSIVQLTVLSGLKPGLRYYITVGKDASDTDGNLLAGDEPQTSDFETLPADVDDRLAPQVSSTKPINGATGVSTLPSLMIFFTKGMSREATEKAITIPGFSYATGDWEMNWYGESTLICTMKTKLAVNQFYTLSVGTGACDNTKNANHLALQYDLNFITAKTDEDTTPPEVIAVTAGRDFEPGGVVRIYFSKPMAPATLNTDSIRMIDKVGGRVAGTVAWFPDGNYAVFTPATQLESFGHYTIIVKRLCTDVNGIPLKKEYTPTMQVKDVTGPTINKVWFDGVAYKGDARFDRISPTAVITADVTDNSGIDYNNLALQLGSGKTVTRSGFGPDDDYAKGRLKYQISPNLDSGTYTITIDAFDVKGQRGTWTGTVQVDTGPVRFPEGTQTYPSTPVINPGASGTGAKAAHPVRATMVYTLTRPGDIDLQIYGPAGQMVWGRHYPQNTPGGMAGYNAVDWGGNDAQGQTVGNGVYAYRVVHQGRVLGTSFIIVSD
jgi:hypothetical protein